MDILKNKPGATYSVPHKHRWMFLTTKGGYEPARIEAEEEPYYQFVEYAYLICNGPGHEAIVRKTEIEKLEDLEFENPKH